MKMSILSVRKFVSGKGKEFEVVKGILEASEATDNNALVVEALCDVGQGEAARKTGKPVQVKLVEGRFGALSVRLA